MIVVTMKIPSDDCVYEDYSHLCDEENFSVNKITRGISNPNLLEDSESTEFLDFVRVADQAWKVDILQYPADSTDIQKRPELYELSFSGFACSLRRTPYYTWQGLVNLPKGFVLTPNIAEQIQVHGGIVTDGKCDLISFDCSHGDSDVSPFEPFARAQLLRRVGESMTPQSDLARFIPQQTPGNKTYKAYSYAKRELESLATQLRQFIN